MTKPDHVMVTAVAVNASARFWLMVVGTLMALISLPCLAQDPLTPEVQPAARRRVLVLPHRPESFAIYEDIGREQQRPEVTSRELHRAVIQHLHRHPYVDVVDAQPLLDQLRADVATALDRARIHLDEGRQFFVQFAVEDAIGKLSTAVEYFELNSGEVLERDLLAETYQYLVLSRLSVLASNPNAKDDAQLNQDLQRLIELDPLRRFEFDPRRYTPTQVARYRAERQRFLAQITATLNRTERQSYTPTSRQETLVRRLTRLARFKEMPLDAILFVRAIQDPTNGILMLELVVYDVASDRFRVDGQTLHHQSGTSTSPHHDPSLTITQPPDRDDPGWWQGLFDDAEPTPPRVLVWSANREGVRDDVFERVDALLSRYTSCISPREVPKVDEDTSEAGRVYVDLSFSYMRYGDSPTASAFNFDNTGASFSAHYMFDDNFSVFSRLNLHFSGRDEQGELLQTFNSVQLVAGVGLSLDFIWGAQWRLYFLTGLEFATLSDFSTSSNIDCKVEEWRIAGDPLCDVGSDVERFTTDLQGGVNATVGFNVGFDPAFLVVQGGGTFYIVPFNELQVINFPLSVQVGVQYRF